MGAHDLLPQAQVIQHIEGGGGLQQPPAGEMEGVERRAQAGMAQQPLDGMRVRARFQQVRGEGISEGISTLLIIRRSSAFATITIPSLVRPSKSSDGYDGRPQKVWSSNSQMALSWRFPRGCLILWRAATCRMRLRHA